MSLILSTSVLVQSTGGDETPNFIGKSLNMVSIVSLVSVEQKKIPGSVFVLFNATDTTKLTKEFLMGETFTKKTRI